jgi:hypothetical protein
VVQILSLIVVIGDGLFPLGICILLRKKVELDFRVGVEEVQVTACKQSIILGCVEFLMLTSEATFFLAVGI